MASEITVSASLTVNKGGVSIAPIGTKVHDMAGDQMAINVQIVGTAAEPLVVGDVTTIGYVFLRNMDATNYIEVALDSAVATQVFAKLLPGGVMLWPASTATLHVKANTAPCNLHVGVTEV